MDRESFIFFAGVIYVWIYTSLWTGVYVAWDEHSPAVCNAGKLGRRKDQMASLKKERTVGIPVLFRGESLLQNVVSECRNMAQLSVLLFLVKY